MSDLILEIKEMVISGLNLEDMSVSDIDENAPLFGEGLGLDSVDALELGLLIQKKYDIVINSKTENVKEIFVVGIEDKETDVVNLQIQRDSIKNNRELDYLFENCMPEFSSGSLDEWLSGKENVSENIEKSIDMICHHPLVPSDVKVHGFKIDRTGEKETVVKVSVNKVVKQMHSYV